VGREIGTSFPASGFWTGVLQGSSAVRVVGTDGAWRLSSGTEVWAAANPVCYNF